MCVMTAPMEGTMGSVALVASALGPGWQEKKKQQESCLDLECMQDLCKMYAGNF